MNANLVTFKGYVSYPEKGQSWTVQGQISFQGTQSKGLYVSGHISYITNTIPFFSKYMYRWTKTNDLQSWSLKDPKLCINQISPLALAYEPIAVTHYLSRSYFIVIIGRRSIARKEVTWTLLWPWISHLTGTGQRAIMHSCLTHMVQEPSRNFM